MDVRRRVFWAVHLKDPVDGGEVQPSGCDVCGEEDHGLGLAKLVEDSHSLHLMAGMDPTAGRR